MRCTDLSFPIVGKCVVHFWMEPSQSLELHSNWQSNWHIIKHGTPRELRIANRPKIRLEASQPHTVLALWYRQDWFLCQVLVRSTCVFWIDIVFLRRVQGPCSFDLKWRSAKQFSHLSHVVTGDKNGVSKTSHERPPSNVRRQIRVHLDFSFLGKRHPISVVNEPVLRAT